MPGNGPEYPCRRNRMSLEGDCKDCAHREYCLTLPVAPLEVPLETEIELEITPDGTAATWWWTQETAAILSALGPPAPGYEELNKNPWCG
jgi:hypothetical protein